MARSSTEEQKLTLPAGHPQQAFTGPDLRGRTPGGALPESEQQWDDANAEAYEAELAAAEEHEDKVAREELKAQEAAASEAETATAAPAGAEKATSKS